MGWGQQKPPQGGILLDLGHPLTQGLSDALEFNDGSTALIKNYANPRYAGTATGTPTSRVTARGRGVYCTGGASIDIPAHGIWESVDFTLWLRFMPVTYTGGFTAIHDQSTRVTAIFADTSGNISFTGTSMGTPATGMTAGSVWDLVVSRRMTSGVAGNARWFVNGRFVATAAANGVNVTSTATTLGRNSSGGGTNADAVYLGWRMWERRALTDAEVQWLYAEPYSVYQPVRRRFYSVPAAAGGNRRRRFLTAAA